MWTSRKNGRTCLCHKYVNDLEYHIMDGIAPTLDIDQKWKKVVAEASKDKNYSLSIDEVRLIEQAHRPSQAMILRLGERGMTIHELVCLLTALRLQKALNYFYKYVNDLLIIEEQPPEFIHAGRLKPLVLRCRAAGSGSVKFQWYHNNVKLKGQTGSELNLSCEGSSQFGKYVCRVHKACPCGVLVAIFTSPCRITDEVEGPAKMPPTKILEKPADTGNQSCCRNNNFNSKRYKAKDKVALLIGNCNYRTAPPLPAVKNDLFAFRDILIKLDFRVFSFIDLGLEEMENALHSFTAMLHEGVYGVFYFAGHGYECGGESYMMPTDCKTEQSNPKECMQVNELLLTMQECQPALCTLFLDMCRLMSAPPISCLRCGHKDVQENAGNFIGRGAEYRPYCIRCHNPLTYKMATIGNRIPLSKDLIINKAVFYATSSGEVAFEKEDGTQGVFMKSLIRCLDSPKTMPMLYECMGQEFLNNSSGSYQKPEAEMRILESRTLHDENEYDGHTAEYKHEQFWDANHGVPTGRTVRYPDGIVFTVDFREMFSNVLIIEVVLQTLPYGVEICVLQPKFSKEVSLLPEVGFVPYQNKLSNVPDFQRETDRKIFKLSEIQRLQHDLVMEMKLYYRYHGNQQCEAISMNLGRPLVAQVWQKLYRQYSKQLT